MKLLYGFVFGLNTLALILCFYDFLQMQEAPHTAWRSLLLLLAMSGCVAALVMIVLKYLQPDRKQIKS